jgi:hypothetical protein
MRPFTKFVKQIFGDKKLIGVEIGVQRGDNALTLVKELQFEQLCLVDIWQDYEYTKKFGKGLSRANFRKYYPIVVKRFGNRSDVNIIREASIEVSKKFSDNYFDFIYIDACHSYEAVKADIKSWFPKIKFGGVFGGHDYNIEIYPGLVQAINEFISENNFNLFQEELDWWIVKKDNSI